MKRLTLYTREGCHLCELMLEALLPRIRGRAEVELIDIDCDPRLVERHGTRVPVLTCGDDEICHYHLDTAALEQRLEA